MKKIIVLIVAGAILFSCEQKKEQAQQTSTVTIGTIDSLFSETLNEQRKFWVYVPGGVANGASSGTKYPVLYLLDGDGHYYSVVGLTHQLSTVNGNTLCPEMIIVGIPNTDRTRDLTPTHVAKVFGDTLFPRTSGGGENFTRFMEEELIPYIDKNYPTTPHRTLVGHSLGGLMVVNTLMHHPELFTNYISIDPSLWWDDQKLSNQARTILDEKKFEGKSLYVAVANTMKEGMKLSDVATDTTESTDHIRAILQFNEFVKTKTSSGLKFEKKYYNDDTHGSVPLIATHDAIRSLFSWYTLKGLDEYFDPKSKSTPQELIDKITNHYKSLSDNFGYNVLPPEAFINSLGYAMMSLNIHDKAYAIFNLNVQNYPTSSNVFDSMGDCYVAQKDTVRAIESFKKALTLADVAHTKEKLRRLQGEK